MRSEEEQELTHWGSSSLASAHGCWPSLSKHSSSFACGRLVGGRLCSWGVRFRSSSFVSVHGHAFPLVGVRLRWWAVISVRARLASLVGVRVQCGGAVGSSWWFVAGSVVSMVRRGASLLFVVE